jgi:hypothetical protein
MALCNALPLRMQLCDDGREIPQLDNFALRFVHSSFQSPAPSP